MAMLGSDGTVVLSADEAAQLRHMVRRWEQAADLPGADVGTPLVELGDAVRNLLAGLPAGWWPPSNAGVPAARFAVLAKRPGHVPTVVSTPALLVEESAYMQLDSLFGDPHVRSRQYALAELRLVENYR